MAQKALTEIIDQSVMFGNPLCTMVLFNEFSFIIVLLGGDDPQAVTRN